MRRILVVDDEENVRFTFTAFLEDAGHEVQTAATRGEALDLLAREVFDLVYLDIALGQENGLDLLTELRQRFPFCPVIMITGAPEVASAMESLRRGAFDYIPKPIRQETLLRVSRQALHHREVIEQRERYRAHLEAIFRSVREGILLVDRGLAILEANAAAMVMLDLPCEVAGLPLSRLAETASLPLRDVAGRAIGEGRAVDGGRLEVGGPGKPLRVLHLTAVPWAEGDGGARGAVVTVRDETRLENLERDLQKRRNFEHIIGQSPVMQQVYTLIENLAEVDTTVLVTGESGTGKELVAEALHCRSVRRNGPLIKVNCAALPENLLESELFGHVKGAFTGAVRDKAGRFQLAHRGTIFLDEIGDISPALQVRLLRVLQNKEIERVGGSQPVPVDVRIVAATNCSLQEKVQRGEFREDLYYRLRVVEIPLPPLRERREDIPLLVDHFVARFNERFGRHVEGVTAGTMTLLTSYRWPGNVRELQHAIEHAFVVCRGSRLDVADLPRELQEAPPVLAPLLVGEAAQIVAALEKAAGNKARAARLLGISRRTIYRKIEEHGIIPPPEQA
ncbi:MAG: response regulator [Deltaproteobacteria bacterium]|nr:MAG: response regulator [Deltaproteobacteria bacterium]